MQTGLTVGSCREERERAAPFYSSILSSFAQLSPSPSLPTCIYCPPPILLSSYPSSPAAAAAAAPCRCVCYSGCNLHSRRRRCCCWTALDWAGKRRENVFLLLLSFFLLLVCIYTSRWRPAAATQSAQPPPSPPPTNFFVFSSARQKEKEDEDEEEEEEKSGLQLDVWLPSISTGHVALIDSRRGPWRWDVIHYSRPSDYSYSLLFSLLISAHNCATGRPCRLAGRRNSIIRSRRVKVYFAKESSPSVRPSVRRRRCAAAATSAQHSQQPGPAKSDAF